MKLSNVTAKLTCMKSKAVRVLAAVTLAGAVLAVAPAAQAQHFSVGVRIGGPRYVAPRPRYFEPAPVYIAPRRFDDRADWARRHDFDRHDRFDRDHRFDDRGFRR